MRILVMSDSHNHPGRVAQALRMAGKVDWLIHLGDGLSDLEDKEVRPLLPDTVLTVLGNNDFGYVDSVARTETPLPDQRLFMTHGHRYSVRQSLLGLAYAAMENRAVCALYGHTHTAHTELQNGILLLNPGAVGDFFNASFALIEWKKGLLTPEIVPIS